MRNSPNSKADSPERTGTRAETEISANPKQGLLLQGSVSTDSLIAAPDTAITDPVLEWIEGHSVAQTAKSSEQFQRRFRPLRFVTGLLLTSKGAGIILYIGVRVLDVQAAAGDFAMALIGIGVLLAVMLLGGGFGLMATASPGFDEEEFERLLNRQ